MPPSNIRTVRELIYWEFAKLVSEIAVGDRKNYRYVMAMFMRFRRDHLHPLEIMNHHGLNVKGIGQCAFCGTTENLTETEIIPLVRGGPDRVDNRIAICRLCAELKNDHDPFEWYGKERKYEIPRLVLARYLKLAYEAHEASGTLDSADVNRDGTLDVYDIGAIFPAIRK